MLYVTSTQDRSVAIESDALLMHRASSGELDAFRTIYDRHVDAISGYARGRVGPDFADDVVGETFATAWHSCGRFDPDAGDARPWLYGIATKVIARHREREQRWVRQHAGWPARTETAVGEPTVYELDPALAHAISSLSAPLRDVLLLTALGEMSAAEAGRALGITATTARVRLLRARRVVRRALERRAP